MHRKFWSKLRTWFPINTCGWDLLDRKLVYCLRDILSTGIKLCVGLANERRRYIVTSSLIGWAHTQSNSWIKDRNFWVTFPVNILYLIVINSLWPSDAIYVVIDLGYSLSIEPLGTNVNQLQNIFLKKK